MKVDLGWPFFTVLALCGIELVAVFIVTGIAWLRTRQRNKARQLLRDAQEQFSQVNAFGADAKPI